jgi:cystathionine beta-synthase
MRSGVRAGFFTLAQPKTTYAQDVFLGAVGYVGGRMIHDSVLGAIGRTPTVRLRRVVPAGSAEVVAKLEFFAPGGSVKDRAALSMVLDGEERGLLKPGATVVEASAGNTGVGLAIVCAVRGYKCVIVLPETTSIDKRSVLAALGAEVVLARADVEPSEPGGYIATAEELAKKLGAFLPDQFDNPSNPAAHYDTTGPEILADCDGRLDAFVACVGSGGTLGGVARYLRQQLPQVRIVGAAPDGDRCVGAHGNSLVEGIVEDLMSCAGQGVSPDEVVKVGDQDAVRMTLRLAREEAILAGGSAGVAVHASLVVARALGPGKRVATIVPDTGRNYLSTYFNAAWRKNYGLD